MVCILLECQPVDELKRFAIALAGLYVYHFLWDKAIITPFTEYMIRKKWLPKAKRDQMRESLWKNAAVGTFFTIGVTTCLKYDWFLDPTKYFVDWPFSPPEDLRWYYRIYFSFWIQSVDFFMNITNHHYHVKRKDNAEMLVHHAATMSLMLGSYFLDLTRVGACVLLLHDVNDLLLETAKIFIYLKKETLSNIVFGVFTIVWFLLRLGFFPYNVIYQGVYTEAYKSILMPIKEQGSYFGQPYQLWYYLWIGFTVLLLLLVCLHIFWAYMIVVMVVKAVTAGKVEKDVRSDSEDDGSEQEEQPTKKEQEGVRRRKP